MDFPQPDGPIIGEDKSEEMCAVGIGLEHFFYLGLVGGILRVDGRIQAFSYGEQQCSDTFVTHVEKAFTDYDGRLQCAIDPPLSSPVK